MLILIADSHLSENTSNLAEFTKFLEWISSSAHDVCFLGDIMELWIALPKFENAMHKEFLDWCRKEIHRRKIYLAEGNHEFFVAERHVDCFSGSSQDCLHIGSDLFCHGDLIQRHQLDHLFFRRMSKSRLSFLLLRFLPGARKIVNFILWIMQKKSRRYSTFLPLPEIHRWCDKKKRLGVQNIFLGHFHQAHQEELAEGIRLFCLPAWKVTQEVAVFDPATRQCSFLHWQELAQKKDTLS
jgi:UDP-2,3-diacylglucosamine pyrophosphatase LpxH